MSKLYVIGMGYKPFEKRAQEIIRSSEIILANDRLLEVLKGYEELDHIKNRLRIINNVYETMEFIKSEIQNPESRIITLLASGDPLFFGIGRMVVKEFDKADVEILPDLSSIQVAFARIKEPWSDAFLMSLHGGPDPEKRRNLEYEIGDIPNLLKTHHKIGILTDKENNPSAIANKLSAYASDLKMFVCERLSYADEKITEGAPVEIARGVFDHPNVVIIVRKSRGEKEGKSEISGPVFGLREDEIQHSKGMITKDETRAIAIHKLRLPETGILWDIGAGSGSISIEAARLCPKLEVIAIEKNEDRIKHIENNKESFGIRNLRVIKGEAPQALNSFPAPGRVFIGGSGGTLDEIVHSISEKMREGILVVNAVTIETLNSAMKCLEEHGFRVDVTEVSIAKSKMINQKRQMSALNPIFIVKGEK